jgi:hypothetical protein
MAALRLDGDEATVEELRQVLAGRRGGDADVAGQLTDGVGPTVEQPVEQLDPCGVAEQAAERDLRSNTIDQLRRCRAPSRTRIDSAAQCLAIRTSGVRHTPLVTRRKDAPLRDRPLSLRRVGQE